MAGDDQLLVKIAVFGIAVSVVCTALIGVLFVNAGNGTGDYSYDEVQAYRNDLISFSGESMLNSTPWVMTHVYTPWNPTLDASSHTTEDGWMFGSDVTDYPGLNTSADIRLDPTMKSSIPLTYEKDSVTYETVDGVKRVFNIPLVGAPLGGLVAILADTFNLGDLVLEKSTHTASNWNYTGYRYVFDPTLPFSDTTEGQTSVRDGSLSLVWYSFNNSEGLMGGLDVYGRGVKLASYSAADIIADYSSANGYAKTYSFLFDGTELKLSIRFDQDAIADGTPLMAAWSAGDWSMAISSTSAGNFFDIDSSTSFTATAGNMISTFIQIYTFNVPSISNPWMDLVLWMLVGLPMTIAMLCVTLRLVNGFRVL